MTPKARDTLIGFIVWIVLVIGLFAIATRADDTTGEVGKRQRSYAEARGVRPTPAQTGDAEVTPRPLRIQWMEWR